MSRNTPRLRMFAGPNGSGKSTVKNGLPAYLFNVYINPDDMEKTITDTGLLPLGNYGVTTDTEELRELIRGSEFLRSNGLVDGALGIECRDGSIVCRSLAMNSYYASVLSDFLRRKLLAASKSFTFETVMSAPDKVELLREAKRAGYRNYLYFVATESPAVNVARVNYRFAHGGHPVPEEKVTARYFRSLDLLREAIRHTDRAYFFDTSGDDPIHFAEITNGSEIDLKTDDVPAWFKKSVLDKF